LKNKVLGPRDTLPPGVERALSMERRFKFKYRGMKNIKASALEEKDFKNRNIVRGDFAKQGIHYNTTTHLPRPRHSEASSPSQFAQTWTWHPATL
jgi:hypothetical protein